MTKKTVSTKWS